MPTRLHEWNQNTLVRSCHPDSTLHKQVHHARWFLTPFARNFLKTRTFVTFRDSTAAGQKSIEVADRLWGWVHSASDGFSTVGLCTQNNGRHAKFDIYIPCNYTFVTEIFTMSVCASSTMSCWEQERAWYSQTEDLSQTNNVWIDLKLKLNRNRMNHSYLHFCQTRHVKRLGFFLAWSETIKWRVLVHVQVHQHKKPACVWSRLVTSLRLKLANLFAFMPFSF